MSQLVRSAAHASQKSPICQAIQYYVWDQLYRPIVVWLEVLKVQDQESALRSCFPIEYTLGDRFTS